MDDIRRMLDRLPELSDEELSGLEDRIVAEFGSVESREISRESVEEMTFLADSVESVRAEMSAREAEAAELVVQASEAAARVTEAGAAVSGDGSEDDEEKAEEEGGKTPPEEFSAADGVVAAGAVDEEEVIPVVEDVAVDDAVAEAVGAAVDDAVGAALDEVVAEAFPDGVPADQMMPEGEMMPEDQMMPEGEMMPVEEEEPVFAAEGSEASVETVEGSEASAETVEGSEASTETVESSEAAAVAVEGSEASTETVEGSEAATATEVVAVVEGVGVAEASAEAVEGSEAAVAEDVDSNESVEALMSDTSTGPAAFSAPADRLPGVRETVPATPISLVAGGDIPGITAGSELSGGKGLAEAMSLRLHTLRRASGGRGDQVVVASLMAQFPEDRTLRGNELDSNSEKISAITKPSAVVASGGWCAPLPVNYDIFDIGGSTATPLKDAMPVFNADRGGVRFIKPPVLEDYVGAVNIWTNQNDIDAADPAIDPPVRKQCLTVKCAEEDEVYLDAITMCMCFGNLQTRAFPELIDRHNQLALVEAARFAEIYILNKIKDQSTAVTLPAVLGAVRDLLISVERAAVAYRHQHRLDPELPLRFIAPQWVGAMIRSDLTAQLPGDGMETTFNVADATINSFFEQRNIRPVWTLDGVGNLPTVTDYPDTVEWGLFAEGTFTLLDGGTLDIGLIRDMDLVSTNDYCMFTEQFMAVAKTGLDSLWVTQSLNVNGGSAGTLDVAAVDY